MNDHEFVPKSEVLIVIGDYLVLPAIAISLFVSGVAFITIGYWFSQEPITITGCVLAAIGFPVVVIADFRKRSYREKPSEAEVQPEEV